MDLEETLIYMLRNGAHSLVSDFFIWGKKQYEAILKSGLVHQENLYITGTPRYDFCSEPWINIYDHPFQEKKYILVNTNFPFIFPKYQTFSQEIDTFNTLSNFSISLSNKLGINEQVFIPSKCMKTLKNDKYHQLDSRSGVALTL